MKRHKFSAAIIALFGTTIVTTTSSFAQSGHWFFDQYRGYEDRTYYDDGDEDFDDDDEVVYVNPRRQSNRYNHARARYGKKYRTQRNRNKRRRLYDLWQNGEQPRYESTRRFRTKKPIRHRPAVRRTRPRIKLTYVPLPRRKPSHLVANPRPIATVKTAPPVKISVPVVDNSVALATVKPAPTKKNPSLRPAVSSKPSQKIQDPAFQLANKPSVVKSQIKQKLANTKSKPVAKPAVIASLPKKKIPAAEKPKAVKQITLAAKPKPAAAAKPKPVIAKPQRKPIAIKLISNKPAPKAYNSLSCRKARALVSEFGFSNIITKTCTGKTYKFNARRDKRPYEIKVSALSGELIDVKKLK